MEKEILERSFKDTKEEESAGTPWPKRVNFSGNGEKKHVHVNCRSKNLRTRGKNFNP